MDNQSIYIKSFRGIKLNGYLNFDLNFNTNPTFLIGINGSGKTTILNLINGLLQPNFFDLISIEFEKIELEIRLSQEIILGAEKKDDSLEIYYFLPGAKKHTLDKSSISKIFQQFREEKEYERVEKKLTVKLIKKGIDILQEIKVISLKLDRKFRDKERDEEEYFFGRRYFLEFINGNNKDLLYSNPLRIPLNESINLWKQFLSNVSGKQKKLSDNFKSDTFKFLLGANLQNQKIQVSFDEIIEKKDSYLQRFNELVQDNDLRKAFDQFYADIDTMDENHAVWRFTAFLEILKLAENYKKESDELYKPVLNLEQILNSFFKETGKRIKISPGEISCKDSHQDDKELNFLGLSSGESQIIILFTKLIFNVDANQHRRLIYLIDEPELSLHVTWQELFVPNLIKARPDVQFILATHAPSIVSEYRHYPDHFIDISRPLKST